MLNCFRWRKTKTRLRVQWRVAEESHKETQGKLMVVEHGMGILLMSSPPDLAQQQFLLVQVRFCNSCRVADNHNTQTVTQLLLRLLSCCPGAPTDVNLHDLVTTDALATNLSAERALGVAGRAGDLTGNRVALQTLHVVCDVHQTSSIANRMFHLNCVDHIPGSVIRVALCLQGSGHMALLRTHLARVIQEKLVIHRFGDSGPQASEYREKVASTFLSSPRPHVQGFRKVLLMLLNGDWRKTGILEHYCNSSSRPVDDVGFKELCVKYLVKGFLGREIKLLPRNNWYGIHSSLDGLGILLCVHGLLWMAFASAFGYTRVDDMAVADPMLVAGRLGAGRMEENDAQDDARGGIIPREGMADLMVGR